MANQAIISGRSAQHIGKKVARILDTSLINTEIKDFANREIYARYIDPIRGKDVFIIQTFNSDPNKDLVELLILLQAAKLASARRITAVLPIIYGSRQDRKDKPRAPITIKLIADLLKTAGADRVITLSLHSPFSVGAFSIPIDNISTAQIFLNSLKTLHDKFNFVIVSPDVGGIGKARYYAKQLNTDIAFADKRRSEANKSEIVKFVGNVQERNCLIVDDMIDTAGSLKNVILELSKQKAKKIYVLATHLILSKNAIQILNNLPITQIFGTDSIYHNELPQYFKIFTVAPLLAKAIYSIHEDIELDNLAESFL